METLKNVANSLLRKKTLDDDMMNTKLKRCLTLTDLIFFGIGHMIGAGIFVVTGTVTKYVAGPGVIVSYILAGIAAFLSSLCYAEFGARVPKAGSAYTYTYITIGEFPAFLVGWNMLLESIIGAASVAKAWSGSVDVLFGGAITNGISHYIAFNASSLDNQPDFVAAGCVFLWSIFVGAGAKISSEFINILTILNVGILLFIVGVSMFYAKISNWTNENNGGFLPFGFSGALAGSASCFYAYAGFESIATASEETKNPIINIPIAISISVITASILYIGASISLTLMVPFNLIDVVAPFPAAFKYNGNKWATMVISIGAIIGLSASKLGALFSLPRFAYSMANDGLIFRALSYVHPKTQTPLVSIAILGLCTAFLALLIELSSLVELLSIGTLLSYTIVSINVILLRYQPVNMCQFQLKPDISTYSLKADDSPLTDLEKKKLMQNSQCHEDIGKLKKRFINISFLKCVPEGCIGPIAVSLMIVFCTCDWIIIFYAFNLLINKVWWIIVLLILSSFGFFTSYTLLCVHEQNTSFLTFQVPFVPLIPVLSVIVNIGLMLKLNRATWTRLFIWLLIGILIYFCYGIRHSNENEKLLSCKKKISYSSGGVANVIHNGTIENDKIDD